MNRQLIKVLRYGVLFLLMASSSMIAQAAESQSPLAWTEWELTSPSYSGLEKTPFLKFTDSRISASVGLNSMGGSYQTTGDRIRFAQLFSTQMAGPAPMMDAEFRYSKALEDVRNFTVSADGRTLTLRGKQTLIFRLTGKSADNTAQIPAQNQDQNRLSWTEWELTSPVYQGLEKTPFLKFTDSRINASVGLNSMNGVYQAYGDRINIDALASTRMAGPAPVMNAETQYSQALQDARTFNFSADGQILTLRGGQTLTFRLKGTTAQDFVATETKIINVGSRLGAELDGDQTTKYLQLEDLSEGGGWGRFTEEKILGFDFVPGYRYQLRVQVERNMRSGEKRLRLLEVFTQQWMRAAQIGRSDKTLEVAPTKVDCTGVGEQECLQVREVGEEWQTLYAPIEGFEFEEGWRYRLQVAVTPVNNPPADSSSLRYVLVRLLDKIPVTY